MPRNDITSNVSVTLAAAGVWAFDAGWSAIVVGSLLVTLPLWPSATVPRGAPAELRQSGQAPP